MLCKSDKGETLKQTNAVKEKIVEIKEKNKVIRGLSGKVSDVKVAVEASAKVELLSSSTASKDIDLKRMAAWAMNYLIRTPRPELNYEPVFQCYPLRCPPVPAGQDPVVSCDTDARMDWEWYYMREISGSEAGREVEAAFHKRIRKYVGPDGRVWATPGSFDESDIHGEKQGAKDMIIHIWGATKILKSLSEDYLRTNNPESKALAQKVMRALKKLAVWDAGNRCWFACGMGALREDGTVVPNGWNAQPAPIVEPLITYYLATQDAEGLDFAKSYARGMMDNCQPDGIRFNEQGVPSGGFDFGPHAHGTMHAVWGVAHLGLITGEQKYLDFAKGTFTWLQKRGTGTGWFPAGPDNCNETCAISDMISLSAMLAKGGNPEYFDYLERYLRNYIGNLQFIITPEFEAYYRKLNQAAGEEKIKNGLNELQKFQGGIVGGSGLNDYENVLLGGVSGFAMFGCCAPEGMRAIYTAWCNAIERLSESKLGPAGVYVNVALSRDSDLGRVVSFFPDEGRMTVKAGVKDDFFLRPPHWAPRDKVRAFAGGKSIAARWSGDYVWFNSVNPGDEVSITYPLVAFKHEVDGLWKKTPELKIKFNWLGNLVVSSDPAPALTPLFTGRPRQLPDPPETNKK